ncbi:hypothetical protein ACTVCO_01315 [Sanguibacter sp. A247]|uniref:hypothetical protein n=1 Tax=unclassified Sanguibacter TaxID=2645534 RepID=UPI003FD73DA7
MGFAPGVKVEIIPCARPSGELENAEADCDLSDRTLAAVDASGEFTASVDAFAYVQFGPRHERVCESDCSVGVTGGGDDSVLAAIDVPAELQPALVPTPELKLGKISYAKDGAAQVAVTGSGFAARESVGLVQCPARDENSVPAGDCLYDYGTRVVADDDGSIVATVVLYTRMQRSNDELVECGAMVGRCVLAVPWPEKGTRMVIAPF